MREINPLTKTRNRALLAYDKTRGISFDKLQATKAYRDFVKAVRVYGAMRWCLMEGK